MDTQSLREKACAYLDYLCAGLPSRSVGSEGNRQATAFFEKTLKDLGWNTQADQFPAVDWEEQGAGLRAGNQEFTVFPSPYSLGVSAEAELAAVASLAELENAAIQDKVVLLHGEIAREQIMPKNFVFYNPEESQRTVALLEQGRPAALVCATGRNSSLAGGAYPFPLIEDGDFDIPSVYMTDEEGSRLLPHVGSTVRLVSSARRIPGYGFNVTGRKGNPSGERWVLTAHIDAKKGTPGALDNAAGVIVLLLLAELLRDYQGDKSIEIVAFNGEDYYAVPGQMLFLAQNQGRLEEISLNVNIDGVGYRDGKTALSFYGPPEGLEARVREVLSAYEGVMVGSQWVQGDHSIFVQSGRPAIAISSAWFTENMDQQDITHTPKDRPEIVDCGKLVEAARVLAEVVRG